MYTDERAVSLGSALFCITYTHQTWTTSSATGLQQQPTSRMASVCLSVTLCIPCAFKSAFRSAFKSVSHPLSHLHPPNLDNIISYWSTTATDIPYVCLCVRLSVCLSVTLCTGCPQSKVTLNNCNISAIRWSIFIKLVPNESASIALSLTSNDVTTNLLALWRHDVK